MVIGKAREEQHFDPEGFEGLLTPVCRGSVCPNGLIHNRLRYKNAQVLAFLYNGGLRSDFMVPAAKRDRFAQISPWTCARGLRQHFGASLFVQTGCDSRLRGFL